MQVFYQNLPHSQLDVHDRCPSIACPLLKLEPASRRIPQNTLHACADHVTPLTGLHNLPSAIRQLGEGSRHLHYSAPNALYMTPNRALTASIDRMMMVITAYLPFRFLERIVSHTMLPRHEDTIRQEAER